MNNAENLTLKINLIEQDIADWELTHASYYKRYAKNGIKRVFEIILNDGEYTLSNKALFTNKYDIRNVEWWDVDTILTKNGNKFTITTKYNLSDLQNVEAEDVDNVCMPTLIKIWRKLMFGEDFYIELS